MKWTDRFFHESVQLGVCKSSGAGSLDQLGSCGPKRRLSMPSFAATCTYTQSVNH